MPDFDTLRASIRDDHLAPEDELLDRLQRTAGISPALRMAAATRGADLVRDRVRVGLRSPPCIVGLAAMLHLVDRLVGGHVQVDIT